MGILEGWETGEIGGNTQQCVIFRYRKRDKGRKVRKKGMGAGKAMREKKERRELDLSAPPPLQKKSERILYKCTTVTFLTILSHNHKDWFTRLILSASTILLKVDAVVYPRIKIIYQNITF